MKEGGLFASPPSFIGYDAILADRNLCFLSNRSHYYSHSIVDGGLEEMS